MVCQACGKPIGEGVRFCPHCGVPMVAAAPVYAAYQAPIQAPMLRPRVQRNLQTLGILWCVFAGFRITSGLAGMFFLRTLPYWVGFSGREFPFGHGFFPGSLAVALAVKIAFSVVLAVLTGFALLTRQPWGRTLGIVAAVLTLLDFPVGTALGIYTLWVLAPAQSGVEYEAIADRS